MSLTKQILFEEEDRLFAPSTSWNRYEREDGTLVTMYKNTPAPCMDINQRNPNGEMASWRYYWEEDENTWLLNNIYVSGDNFSYTIHFNADHDRLMSTKIEGNFEHYNNWLDVPWKKIVSSILGIAVP